MQKVGDRIAVNFREPKLIALNKLHSYLEEGSNCSDILLPVTRVDGDQRLDVPDRVEFVVDDVGGQ